MKRLGDASVPGRLLHHLPWLLGLMLSLILAGAIVRLMYIQSHTQEKAKVKLLVAKDTIPALTEIKPDMLSLFLVDADSVPPSAFTEDDVTSVFGKKPVITLQKGDLIFPSEFGAEGKQSIDRLSVQIPKTQELIYITTNEIHYIPSQLKNGDIISIIVINKKSELEALRLLENVKIGDIIRSKDEQEPISAIGLYLSPQQAVVIAQHQTGSWEFQLLPQPQSEKVTTEDVIPQATDSAQPSYTPIPAKQ